MKRYGLSPHVYSCIVEGHAIFFDLKSDQFSALDSSGLALLESTVEGWQGASGLAPVADKGSEAVPALLELVNQGILTDGQSGAGAAPSASVTPARRDAGRTQTLTRKTRMSCAFRFFMAWVEMWWMTRFWSIERIVSHVRKSKAHGRRIAKEANEGDYLLALQDFRQCQRARWLRAGDGIGEAVFLIQFMFRLDLYPTWVFGVRLKPFAARSWIQVGDLALNIPVDSARQFTPILAV